MSDMKKRDKMRDKKQLLPGITVAVAISFLVFLYAPVDLYCSNISEFWFDFGILFVTAFGMFLAGALIMSAVYAVLWIIHPVIYRIGLALGFLVLVCTYVQGNFLVKNLPPLDGSTIYWENYTVLRTEDIILWGVASIVIVLLFIFLKQDKFSKTVMYAGGGLTLVLLVTSLSIVFTSGALQERAHYQVGAEHTFEMSEQQNFVILLLDAADARNFSGLLEKNPEYSNTFRDFTYFENTIGAYSCTERAIPYILSGDWYENEEPFEEYMHDMYQNAPLLQQLQDRGYGLELCDTEVYMDDEAAAQFDNIYRVQYRLSSYLKLAKQELKLIGYRYAPYDLKKKCEFKMVGFDELLVIEDAGENLSFDASNHIFLERLRNTGITEEEISPKFKFIHLEGAHVPFIYDADVNVIDEREGTYEQNMEASVTIAGEYIRLLKDSGAYDNTVVIVMADHGYNGSLDEAGDAAWLRPCPLFLVKGINESHDSMQISEAPISFEDLQEAYVRLLDGKISDEIFDWKEGDTRERRFLKYSFLDEDHMEEYLQTGYAFDMDTMIPTGREFNR